MTERRSAESLGKELTRLVQLLLRRERAGPWPEAGSMSPETFRAVVAQRLGALEREVADVRARVNGLVFVVLGAAVTQVVMRVIG